MAVRWALHRTVIRGWLITSESALALWRPPSATVEGTPAAGNGLLGSGHPERSAGHVVISGGTCPGRRGSPFPPAGVIVQAPPNGPRHLLRIERHRDGGFDDASGYAGFVHADRAGFDPSEEGGVMAIEGVELFLLALAYSRV